MRKVELARESIEKILQGYGVTIGKTAFGELNVQMINPEWEEGSDKVFFINSAPINNTPF